MAIFAYTNKLTDNTGVSSYGTKLSRLSPDLAKHNIIKNEYDSNQLSHTILRFPFLLLCAYLNHVFHISIQYFSDFILACQSKLCDESYFLAHTLANNSVVIQQCWWMGGNHWRICCYYFWNSKTLRRIFSKKRFPSLLDWIALYKERWHVSLYEHLEMLFAPSVKIRPHKSNDTNLESSWNSWVNLILDDCKNENQVWVKTWVRRWQVQQI